MAGYIVDYFRLGYCLSTDIEDFGGNLETEAIILAPLMLNIELP